MAINRKGFKVGIRTAAVVALCVVGYYIGRPVYWKITASMQELREKNYHPDAVKKVAKDFLGWQTVGEIKEAKPAVDAPELRSRPKEEAATIDKVESKVIEKAREQEHKEEKGEKQEPKGEPKEEPKEVSDAVPETGDKEAKTQ